VFAIINLVGAGRFLDQYFYYAVAVLMLFLFSQQANAFARESTLRRREEARAEKLEYVLAGLQETEAETMLSVKSSGRLSRVAARDIAYISGAGDYTEIVTATGDTLLHSATLTELEESLPAFYLRVHRSYLVNTRLIASLKRNSTGTGELRLVTDQRLPVSRRIMPRVKAALA
jgi:DNA-binding LytR/AlgR family response regulator